MPADGTLKIGTQVDISALQRGIADAQLRVRQASADMADAWKAFGAASAAGSKQATDALISYQKALNDARARLSELQRAQQGAETSTRGLDSAAAALAGRIGGGFLGAQLGRVTSQFGLLGSAAGALTPIFLGLAGVDFGVHLAEQAYQAYESFISLDAINQKLLDDVHQLQQADFVKVHSIEAATSRLHEAESSMVNLKNLSEDSKLSGLFQILSGNVAGGAGLLSLSQSAGKFAEQSFKDSTTLQAKQVEAQHQINVAQIEAAHAADSALVGQARITAELQKQLALHKEERDFTTREDQLTGRIAPQGQGAQLQALKDAQARGEAQAQLANLARENYTKELAFEQDTRRLIDEEARAEVEANNKVAAAAREHLSQVSGYTRAVQSMMAEDDRASTQYHKSYEEGQERVAEAQAKMQETQTEQNASIAEAAIGFQVATGRMTALAAAHELGAIHAADYAQKLAELRAELDRINSDPNLTQTQKDEKSAGINNQIAQVSGQRQTTAIQDQRQAAQLAAQPWMTAANQISDAWIGAFNKIRRRPGIMACTRAGQRTDDNGAHQ